MKRAPQRPRSTASARPGTRGQPLRIALLAFDDAQVLDITGPLEVFGRASRLLREEYGATGDRYTLELLSAHGPVLCSSSGLRLVADKVLPRGRTSGGGTSGTHPIGKGRIVAEAPRERTRREASFDTLLISGGRGVHHVAEDKRVLAWVREQAPRVRRLASVCTGAFVLAAAGILDGRRAVTHWSECEQLASLYPRVTVEEDPIFIRDGHVYTSAGVTAGMDLALALVEEDCGRDVAMAVARELVLFLRRPGGQSQFSVQLSTQTAEREPLRDLQAWMADHPGEDLRIPALARRAAMSERHFRRAFTAEVGCPPARFVEQVRVEAARRALEDTTDGVDAIAERLGFGTSESMRRAFTRMLHISPTAYRERFRAEQPHRERSRAAEYRRHRT